MKNGLRAFILSVLAVSFLGISACGKMSDATPIEETGYPHTYPRR